MKPKISVFIATSLDGYIARKDGSIDWLMEANSLAPPQERIVDIAHLLPP
ncbi:hypothetical protein QPW88_08640 [Legionella pneumophila]